MIDIALAAGSALLDPWRILFMLLGIAIGLVVGILPGLSGVVGMALVLPFIFGMDTYTALAMLIGMVAVIHTADTFPSVMLGVPGSAGSQATVVDGYPLAQKGEAARALGAAFLASLIGGVFGALVLFLILPVSRPLVLAFGSPELLMLTVLGLSMVGVLSGKRPLLGIISGALGLLVGAVGVAPGVPYYRYTFGSFYLFDGVPLVVVALGLFALPEVLDLLIAGGTIASTPTLGKGWLDGIRDVLRHKWLVLRSSGIGVFVGAIPGLGGTVVDWISYGFAIHTCPNPETFGKGDIRGVIAPESSNNAKEGGALIPTLLFGVPGSGTTAILLGGFVVLGLEAGPRMVRDHMDVILLIIWTLALANAFGAVACLVLSPWIARLTLVPATRLAPFILVIIMLGAYQSTRHWGDLLGFAGIGLFGWIAKHLEWPRVPFLIGFILSRNVERYLHLSVSRYGWEWVSHPGVIVIGVLTLLLVFAGMRIKERVSA